MCVVSDIFWEMHSIVAVTVTAALLLMLKWRVCVIVRSVCSSRHRRWWPAASLCSSDELCERLGTRLSTANDQGHSMLDWGTASPATAITRRSPPGNAIGRATGASACRPSHQRTMSRLHLPYPQLILVYVYQLLHVSTSLLLHQLHTVH